MAKDYEGNVIVWVLMYQEPYECDWHNAGVYHDFEGAAAHAQLISSPINGEIYKIEARNITSTKEAVQRLKDSKKSRAESAANKLKETA